MHSQLTFTCSKSNIQTLEKGEKYVFHDIFLVFLLLTLSIFHIFSGASIVDFGQVNVSWVNTKIQLCKLTRFS